MLVLTRKPGQELVISVAGREVRIVVAGIRKSYVRIGIEAPDEVKVLRRELVGTEPRG